MSGHEKNMAALARERRDREIGEFAEFRRNDLEALDQFEAKKFKARLGDDCGENPARVPCDLCGFSAFNCGHNRTESCEHCLRSGRSTGSPKLKGGDCGICGPGAIKAQYVRSQTTTRHIEQQRDLPIDLFDPAFPW